MSKSFIALVTTFDSTPPLDKASQFIKESPPLKVTQTFIPSPWFSLTNSLSYLDRDGSISRDEQGTGTP